MLSKWTEEREQMVKMGGHMLRPVWTRPTVALHTWFKLPSSNRSHHLTIKARSVAHPSSFCEKLRWCEADATVSNNFIQDRSQVNPVCIISHTLTFFFFNSHLVSQLLTKASKSNNLTQWDSRPLLSSLCADSHIKWHSLFWRGGKR